MSNTRVFRPLTKPEALIESCNRQASELKEALHERDLLPKVRRRFVIGRGDARHQALQAIIVRIARIEDTIKACRTELETLGYTLGYNWYTRTETWSELLAPESSVTSLGLDTDIVESLNLNDVKTIASLILMSRRQLKAIGLGSGELDQIEHRLGQYHILWDRRFATD
ncbi:hypothetical protein H0V99_01120 [Candidatus Saccharibacteria bacterium]|nr:hypothetical protein [Candidatus Saccharibacteria bacterium]